MLKGWFQMRLNETSVNYIGIGKGTGIYYPPISSSLYREIVESNKVVSTSSTGNTCQSPNTEQISYQTNNFKEFSQPSSLGATALNHIAQLDAKAKENIISQYCNEIRMLIKQDDFVDGKSSESEHFMLDAYKHEEIDFVADALMSIYSSCLDDAHVLEGILTMISCVPYEAISPKGQIMAMGLLTNKALSVRDKAIQCFEKWNSKKGLDYLKSIECSPAWLQKYVNKVIMYIERDGNE